MFLLQWRMSNTVRQQCGLRRSEWRSRSASEVCLLQPPIVLPPVFVHTYDSLPTSLSAMPSLPTAGALRQVALSSARRIPGANLFEQGAGQMQLPTALLHAMSAPSTRSNFHLLCNLFERCLLFSCFHSSTSYAPRRLSNTLFHRAYTPQLSLQPSLLDMRQCPYMWPFCAQPLYPGGQPLVLNLTIINGVGAVGTSALP